MEQLHCLQVVSLCHVSRNYDLSGWRADSMVCDGYADTFKLAEPLDLLGDASASLDGVGVENVFEGEEESRGED
jgi:hypothetical protein